MKWLVPMKTITLRESPVPVLVILAGLFGFVEYLHWSVVQREQQVEIVVVPAAPPGQGRADTEEEAPSVPTCLRHLPLRV